MECYCCSNPKVFSLRSSTFWQWSIKLEPTPSTLKIEVYFPLMLQLLPTRLHDVQTQTTTVWITSTMKTWHLYFTSSLAIVMLSVTSEKTVGFMKYPVSPKRSPPHSSLAPSDFPDLISLRTLLNISSSIWNEEHKQVRIQFTLQAYQIEKYYPVKTRPHT